MSKIDENSWNKFHDKDIDISKGSIPNMLGCCEDNGLPYFGHFDDWVYSKGRPVTIHNGAKINKSIELTNSQIESIKSRTTMLMLPVDFGFIITPEEWIETQTEDELVELLSPLQKGDKDVWVKEEFSTSKKGEDIQYCLDYPSVDAFYDWCDYSHQSSFHPSQMTKKQSRFKFDVLGVKIVKVQDVVPEEPKFRLNLVMNTSSWCKGEALTQLFKEYYNNQLKELKINRTYEDNDCIFLVEVENIR